MDRDAALALLRQNHPFPGPYEFRVVVRPPDVANTVSAIAAGIGEGSKVQKVDERRSAKGNYVALHVTVFAQDAERILDVYEVLKGVSGILAAL